MVGIFHRDLFLLPSPNADVVPKQSLMVNLVKDGYKIDQVQLRKEWAPDRVLEHIRAVFQDMIPGHVQLELLVSHGCELLPPKLSPGQVLDGFIISRIWKDKPLYIRPSSEIGSVNQMKLERMREEALKAAGQAPTIQIRDEGQSEVVKRYMAERDELYKLQITQKRQIQAEAQQEKSGGESAGETKEETKPEQALGEDEDSPAKKRKTEADTEEAQKKRLTRADLEKVRKERLRESSSSDTENEKEKEPPKKKHATEHQRRARKKRRSRHSSSSSSSSSSSDSDSKVSSSSEDEKKYSRKQAHNKSVDRVAPSVLQQDKTEVKKVQDRKSSPPEQIHKEKSPVGKAAESGENKSERSTTAPKLSERNIFSEMTREKSGKKLIATREADRNTDPRKESDKKESSLQEQEVKQTEKIERVVREKENKGSKVTDKVGTSKQQRKPDVATKDKEEKPKELPKESLKTEKEKMEHKPQKKSQRSRSRSSSYSPRRRRSSSSSSSRSPPRARRAKYSSSSSRSRSRSSRSSDSSRSRSRSPDQRKSRSKSRTPESKLHHRRKSYSRSKSPEAMDQDSPDSAKLGKSHHEESFYTAPEDDNTPAKPSRAQRMEGEMEVNETQPSKTATEAGEDINRVASTRSTENKENEEHAEGHQFKPQRKRRWGQTRTANKKPAITISTDSLKGIIEIKASALRSQPVLDLSPEEGRLSTSSSDAEEEEEEKQTEDAPAEEIQETKMEDKSPKRDEKEVIVDEEMETENTDDTKQITRTIQQDVKDVTKENEENKSEEQEEVEQAVTMHVDTTDAVEPEPEQDGKEPAKPEKKKERTPKKSSGSKRGERREPLLAVNLSAEEPQAARRSPSPPRNSKNNIVHVANLVRPYTLNQLKELLSRTGTLKADAFWIDKIKSHCYVTYENEDQAEATRNALHGTRWPSSNPKVLRVDFSNQEQLDYYMNGEKVIRPPPPTKQPSKEAKTIEKPEKSDKKERRESYQDGTREVKLKEQVKRDPPIREWDRHKLRQSRSPSPEKNRRERERNQERRRSPDRTRMREDHGRDRFAKDGSERESDKSRERHRSSRDYPEKRDKEPGDAAAPQEEEQSVKLLDELFHKTKATPCIYWLPLTQEQIVEKEQKRKIREEELEKAHKDAEKAREATRQEREKRNERRRRSPERSTERTSSRRSRDRDSRGNHRR